MVSFTINEETVEEMTIFGDLQTIFIEVVCMLCVIYKAISERSEEAGETFKECIESAIKDGIVFCDEDEREKIIEKKSKDVTAEIEQLLREIRQKK